LVKSLFSHLSFGQMLRYLGVGAWNTLFGYACYFLMVRLLLHVLPTPPSITASIATVIATVINVTVSFLGYKWFVFRTKGNYWHEYCRSMLVYLPSLFISAVAIAPMTAVLRLEPHIGLRAPYVAGALLSGFTVIASFFGHKHISFRSPKPEA
jgi:putative flippase GtrA